MEKEFIPHEQAFILKEMGFSELCVKVCFKDGSATYNRIGNEGEAMCQSDKKEGKDYAATIPTYSQAFRWFRDNHNIHGNVAGRYLYEITGIGDNKALFSKEFETYEEAELACLKKLIEITKGANEITTQI